VQVGVSVAEPHRAGERKHDARGTPPAARGAVDRSVRPDVEVRGEIASALGMSVGSIGTTLSRARRRLVEQYERLQQEQQRREGNAAS